jgi:UDP-N-acetylmuramyl pentapeptide synthase
VGPLGRFLAEGAVEAGLPSGEVRTLETPEQAANLLDSMLDAGDTVLFKASRGVGLERAVEMLAAEPAAGPRPTGAGAAP